MDSESNDSAHNSSTALRVCTRPMKRMVPVSACCTRTKKGWSAKEIDVLAFRKGGRSGYRLSAFLRQLRWMPDEETCSRREGRHSSIPEKSARRELNASRLQDFKHAAQDLIRLDNLNCRDHYMHFHHHCPGDPSPQASRFRLSSRAMKLRFWISRFLVGP